LENCDTILTVANGNISVLVQILRESLKREKLGTTKEETLGLMVLVVRFSWVGKHCKHLR